MKWATRKGIYTDRVACCWLIQRYIDPDAEFHFFERDRLLAEAGKIGAKTFDAPGADYTHVGRRCSFEALMAAYGLEGRDPGLDRLATIVNAIDVKVYEKDFSVPESHGLWALAEGIGRTMPRDEDRLRFGLDLYDALLAWCTSGPKAT